MDAPNLHHRIIYATQIVPSLFDHARLVHLFEVIQKTGQPWILYWDDSSTPTPELTGPIQMRPYPALLDCIHAPRELPVHRNVTVDTRAFIQSGYAKYACVRQWIQTEPDPNAVLCWMEPDNVFFVPHTPICLTDELNVIQYQLQSDAVDSCRVYIPGEWNPVQEGGDIDYLQKSPHWRFNGKCVFGKRTGMEAWARVGEQGIRRYYEMHPATLVWEFNVLAWTEYMWNKEHEPCQEQLQSLDTEQPQSLDTDQRQSLDTDQRQSLDTDQRQSLDTDQRQSLDTAKEYWPVIWYVAPPDGSMFQLPIYLNLSATESATVVPLDCPTFPYLYASSASRVETPRETVVNIRYINYRIEGDGRYIFPPNVRRVHTQNYVIVRLPDETEYRGWALEQVGLPPLTDRVPFTTGLEDVRLYYDIYTDTIRFVATTLEYSATPKIVTGHYEIQWEKDPDHPAVMTCGQLMASPGGIATKNRWEKNWIPIDHPCSKAPSFIYKWGPLQIGLPSADGELRIHTEHACRLTLMKKVCGSSPFVRDISRNQYMGVVHYYDNSGGVRKYRHFLLWLDMDTLQPCAMSVPFSFTGQSVEYCLSVHFSSSTTITFMVSVWDRDPIAITIKDVIKDMPSFKT